MDPVMTSLAALGTVSAVMVVTRRNPIYAAVWLLVSFLCVAAVFVALSAAFLAAIHVLVYTGAILVLFLFVIMLLNLRDDELGEEHPFGARLAAAALAFAAFIGVAVPTLRSPLLLQPTGPAPEGFGSLATVGELLFVSYGLPFELVSVLILGAMFGGLVIAKKGRGPHEDEA
jgi:NADH-quinone oxidoreductase subunit J